VLASCGPASPLELLLDDVELELEALLLEELAEVLVLDVLVEVLDVLVEVLLLDVLVEVLLLDDVEAPVPPPPEPPVPPSLSTFEPMHAGFVLPVGGQHA
jgi:hypothetical protein